MKYVLAVILCLVTSASYGGVSINGTTITFSDATVQTTAKPLDHGGTNNIVSGTDSFIGGGYSNLVTDDYGAIGGGQDNQAGDDAGTTSDRKWATVGGGYLNVASGHSSTIGGGQNNTASGHWSTVSGGFAVFGNTASGDWSTVGGGGPWSNTASGYSSTVGGGNGNTASGESATVGGGGGPSLGNTASGDFSTVSGGVFSTASGKHSTVSGGYLNIASGYSSTVGGGYQNMASGDFSFVAGLWANDSGHNNVFVWNDGTGGTASASNTFNVNASGGIYLNGVSIHASDRNKKKDFSFVSGRDILDKVVELPIQTWRFKTEEDSISHIGPMAQDFMAAFGYGLDDRYLSTLDMDGVTLAAIQGLNAKVEGQAETITALRWHNAQLEARLVRLENAILREPEVAQTGTD